MAHVWLGSKGHERVAPKRVAGLHDLPDKCRSVPRTYGIEAADQSICIGAETYGRDGGSQVSSKLAAYKAVWSSDGEGLAPSLLLHPSCYPFAWPLKPRNARRFSRVSPAYVYADDGHVEEPIHQSRNRLTARDITSASGAWRVRHSF